MTDKRSFLGSGFQTRYGNASANSQLVIAFLRALLIHRLHLPNTYTAIKRNILCGLVINTRVLWNAVRSTPAKALRNSMIKDCWQAHGASGKEPGLWEAWLIENFVGNKNGRSNELTLKQEKDFAPVNQVNGNRIFACFSFSRSKKFILRDKHVMRRVCCCFSCFNTKNVVNDTWIKDLIFLMSCEC